MGFELVAPSTVAEALALARPDASGTPLVLAGGTDLLRDLDDGRVAPARVISLRRMPWRSITWEGESVTIGSTRSLRALELDDAVRTRLPGLWEALRSVGGVALRQHATLGGNIARASPASDLLPILLAHDAEVSVVSGEGSRRVPIADVLVGARKTSLGPGELIEAIRIPHVGPSTYVWQRVRPANDISQVGLAAAFAGAPATWRVALGGVMPRPVRLPTVEALLGTGMPEPATVARASREAAERSPFVSDKRATEAYRRHLVTVLLRRAVGTVIDRAAGGKGP
ncbi:MAG: FAD binding domain-containing protein [Thermoplasmata archaeon]|nr:FAD binding domain-containing protein [Thermoplasmata archaeon]